MDDVFKIPIIPTPASESTTSSEQICSSDENKNQTESDANDEPKETNCSKVIGPQMPTSDYTTSTRHKNLQYNVPEWSGVPVHQYSMEVLRNGSIIDNVYLSNRAYTVFGRSPDSDIVLEHPTISRYHAIIQYKADFENNLAKGLYIYDCGSTHGTFINKKRIDPKVYTRLKVGFIVKFGQSTRLYVVQGDHDAEEESQNSNNTGEGLTHEQMKKFHEKRAKKLAEVRARREHEENDSRTEEPEMDWGMGLDVQESEKQRPAEVVKRSVTKEQEEQEKRRAIEKDIQNRLEYQKAKNDQAVLSEIISQSGEAFNLDDDDPSEQEAFYLKDPKRALTTFFEREGAELSYDVEDRHFGSYRCTIKLPIVDELGRSMQAEVEENHCKKKDIINRCILEACRILDEHGVLREGTATSTTNSIRVKDVKRKILEENDFYDEDEDTFFDRTGDIEKKRLKRMEWAGVTSQEKPVENFDSLKEKLSKLYQEQVNLEEKLEEAQRMEEINEKNSAENATNNDEDDLDIYIKQLKQGERLTIKVKSQWRRRIAEIEDEERQFVKLLKVCKPRDFDISNWRKTIRDQAKEKLKSVQNGKK